MADIGGESTSLDGKKRKSRRRWLWLLVLAPAFGVIAWLEPDEEDLFELCSTQGRPTIYRSVEAEGYYDGATEDCWGCWNYLANTDYTFIEFSIIDDKAWGPINEPGIYRASRIPDDSPECDEKLTSFYTKTRLRREEFERRKCCFALEKFDARQARYGYYSEGLGRVSSSPITGSSISASRIYYRDHDNDEILAESTDYALAKYPFFRVSSFRSVKVCNDYIEQLGVRGLDRQEVIKPRRSVDNEHTD